MVDGLTHLDDKGRARMVDVSRKDVTDRTAVAEAYVTLSAEVADLLFEGRLPKGDALAVVRVAAIMAAKRTPDLIPLCHPLPVDGITVDVERTEHGARIEVTDSTPTSSSTSKPRSGRSGVQYAYSDSTRAPKSSRSSEKRAISVGAAGPRRAPLRTTSGKATACP